MEIGAETWIPYVFIALLSGFVTGTFCSCLMIISLYIVRSPLQGFELKRVISRVNKDAQEEDLPEKPEMIGEITNEEGTERWHKS